ncbi:MAG TPA: 8-amino-7-oxononanoate synthase [Pedobacter sp.]
MEEINNYIDLKLEERTDNGSLRTLSVGEGLIDFCSNDYLGLSGSLQFKKTLLEELNLDHSHFVGATGSRLISGNDQFTEDLEKEIAVFHQAESALIFNSGYDANVGLFSCLANRGDTIILDELIHASIIDGARLSNANRYAFKHNDLQSLEDKLKISKGKIFIGIESIYSMDGDMAPLAEIIALADAYSAVVIVDEAHAVGIFGSKGRGLVEQNGLSDKVFARVITFGKALGCHGACVVGSNSLRKYLINFARSFIYTTAASFYTHLSVKMAYKYLDGSDIAAIHQKIELFKTYAAGITSQIIPSFSPIQCVIVAGNIHAKKLACALQQQRLDVRAILHPTVPAGKERLRICLHTFNTDDEISNLVKAIEKFL